jgi:hypothetical protein
MNFHHWCLTQENFTKFEMEKFWSPLATGADFDGLEFIAAMEAKDYPIWYEVLPHLLVQSNAIITNSHFCSL